VDGGVWVNAVSKKKKKSNSKDALGKNRLLDGEEKMEKARFGHAVIEKVRASQTLWR